MPLIQQVRKAFTLIFSCCIYAPIDDNCDSDQGSTSKSIELRELAPSTDLQQYLRSGNIYIARGNPQAALQVYQIGLRWAALDEAKRDALQKEIRKVSATIDRQRKIQDLDPASVWNLIFGMLQFNDLLHCACVCKAWRNFIIHIPRFRHQLPVKILQREELVSWSLSEKRKFPVIEVLGPLASYRGMNVDIIKFLSCWNYTSSQRLRFNSVDLLGGVIFDLQSTLRSIKPPITRLDIVGGRIRAIYAAALLKACSASITHVTLNCTVVSSTSRQNKYYESQLYHGQTTPTKFYFPRLTYLKLDFASTGKVEMDVDDVDRIPAQIMGASPNLIHLFLSTACVIHHDDCIAKAFEYCPWLKTLVVSPSAELPAAISKQIDEVRSDPPLSDKFWTREGLDTFVLDGAVPNIDNNTIISVFDKTFGSLKRLYLTLNPHTRIGTTALARLASHGAPCLREIYLVSQAKYPTVPSLHGEPPVIPTLITLFSKCPSLEVIEIANYIKFLGNSSALSTGGEGNRKTWRDMLLTIARCCPRLRHLKFGNEFHYTATDMLDFVSTGGSKLIYLEVNTSHKTALKLVTKFNSLKYLCLYQQEDASGKCLPMLQSQRDNIFSILEQRGGNFILK